MQNLDHSYQFFTDNLNYIAASVGILIDTD